MTTTLAQHRRWRSTPRGRELWKAARAKYRRAHYGLVLASNMRRRRRQRGWPEWALGLPRTATLLQVMAAWRRWSRRRAGVVDAARPGPGTPDPVGTASVIAVASGPGEEG